MNGDLKKLYSETIRSHQASPFHFDRRNSSDITLKAYNPICGDKFELYFTLNRSDNQPVAINEFYFHGYGCAISKASTSVMVKTLLGKSPKDALELCNQFLGFVNAELTTDELILPEEFLAFSGVREFPERIDCATLAWREIQKFLDEKLKGQQ